MVAGRPKKYKNTKQIGTNIEYEDYVLFDENCAMQGVEKNSIFQEAVKQFNQKCANGEIITSTKEPEIPSVFANRNELLAWAHRVGPEGARKCLDNLAFLHKGLSEQMRAIELSAKTKSTTNGHTS